MFCNAAIVAPQGLAAPSASSALCSRQAAGARAAPAARRTSAFLPAPCRAGMFVRSARHEALFGEVDCARLAAVRLAPKPEGDLRTRAGLGNSFGHLFRISTFGESHGGGVGVIVDGCPPSLPITVEEIQAELDRRKPGQSRITTPRKEDDLVEILSGVADGLTTGTPIAMLVRNKDQRSGDYEDMAVKYRPSHADMTYDQKYGLRSVAGGGRSSARETIGRVAAGAIAKKILAAAAGVEIVGYVKRVRDVEASIDPSAVTLEQVESNIVRCPDAAAAERMLAVIDEIRKKGNSIGGVVECVARGVPVGLGAPVFDKLEADLAKGMMSLPASKGFEVGSGFEGTLLTGQEHNDEFYVDQDGHGAQSINLAIYTSPACLPVRPSSPLPALPPRPAPPRRALTAPPPQIRTRTNRSGGIQGGISNGEDIVRRPAAPVPLPGARAGWAGG
eukprot:tig00020610_g12054.t1